MIESLIEMEGEKTKRLREEITGEKRDGERDSEGENREKTQLGKQRNTLSEEKSLTEIAL